MPTSSYDVYMVDTPEENNGEEWKDAAKGCSLEKQSKRRRKRRSKSRLGKNSDNSARKNNTPIDSRGNNDHTDPATEQDEPADGEHSTEPLSDHGDAEDKAHQPLSGEENSPERKTVRMTMHTSSRKGPWNKRTSIEGLLPPRGV